jgi:transposase
MYGLAQGFVEMVSQQQATVFESWLKTAESSKIKELVGFARSLKSDFDAVLASLKLPYSNGQVEGQINKLKFLKRQRFGRAKFDLLRIQVLAF